MSLGLDDLLQGLANQYETYVYLLQQRSRGTVQENVMNKRQLRKVLRKAMNESRYGSDRKLGYGSGSIVADMSDEIMEIVRHCLENGMSEEDIRFRANNAVEAAILSFKRVRR